MILPDISASGVVCRKDERKVGTEAPNEIGKECGAEVDVDLGGEESGPREITPSAWAVDGISCMRPFAPFLEIALGLYPDSAIMIAFTRAGSTWWRLDT